jgi:hypothetical protein
MAKVKKKNVTTLSTDKDAEKPDYADIIAGNIK